MHPKITPEMKLGMKEFEKTMFMLNVAPNRNNLDQFSLQGDLTPAPLDELAWFLPAYLSNDFNLFFIFAPNINNQWAISCSQVQIKDGNQIMAMSETVSTGIGLNAVNELSPSSAIELIAYLKTLEVNGLGYFDEHIGKNQK
ncbi:hypothetical protein H5S40_03225 [Limosilactobacillus sp. RRLNB_1_1]|uniref:Uncharacterized protein n=1 Tax=Limosilactobacillus albertensis TaxID=2759752 RepID=A0A7W3TRD0_9LACO|nr:hypothetical protein [Limosilactobacillus albertensis]MBB1069166.1 hypothetical protein [Limosilactobacillus albertensis]MCD7117559.1 hypothetical protein [Limosilactobacillus albertensis]MCD7128339.1 hypothetical protein [Limosilactobacillus albertensis]